MFCKHTVSGAAIFFGTLLWAQGTVALDRELERLKAEASKVTATLVIKASTYRRKAREYEQTLLHFNTATRQYILRYKTFPGVDAALNRKELNDCSSGLGMLRPHACWYHNGFLDALLTDDSGKILCDPANMQGRLTKLAGSEDRAGCDLAFANGRGRINLRIVALAGQDPLFVSIRARRANVGPCCLNVRFTGYPFGFKSPFDRWVHMEKNAIPNAGRRRQTVIVRQEQAPWMLLTDHGRENKGMAGMLGLVFAWNRIVTVTVEHSGNYAVKPGFAGKLSQTPELRFMVFTFTAITRDQARAKLVRAAANAVKLFGLAFRDLPEPFTNKTPSRKENRNEQQDRMHHGDSNVDGFMCRDY